MSNALVKILYNPGSINTAESIQAHNTDAPPEFGRDNALSAFAILTRLQNSTRDTRATHAQLIALKRRLLLPIELTVRLDVIKSVRATLKALAANFAGEVDLFQAFIQNIMLIKDQMDLNPQDTVELARKEWIELECVIFELSRWEEQISYFWAEAL